jgi:acyl-CoA thioesterase
VATTPSAADFARDTSVVATGDGVWAATISDQWAVPRGPNGGYIAAIVLRAMEAAVADPVRAPRSLTLHYLRPPQPGPCTVHVTVERAGGTLTSLSARLLQDGRTMVVALGAFAADFPSAADYALPAPAVGPPPAPEALRTAPEGLDLPPIAHRVATVPVFGARPFSGADEAVAGGWLRLTEPHAADAFALAFYADAWLPAPYARLTGPAPAPTIDLTIHFRTRLPHPGMAPEDPVLARFSSSTAFGGYFEEDGALWAPDGTLLVQSRQLALLFPGG